MDIKTNSSEEYLAIHEEYKALLVEIEMMSWHPQYRLMRARVIVDYINCATIPSYVIDRDTNWEHRYARGIRMYSVFPAIKRLARAAGYRVSPGRRYASNHPLNGNAFPFEPFSTVLSLPQLEWLKLNNWTIKEV